MTTDEIVKALKLCAGDRCCEGCIEEQSVRHWQIVMREAADLIESLQAQFADRGTRPATNADHLRRMSDEELAKFQASRFNFTWKYMPESRWLDWLHQPAEEAHDGQA